MKSPSLGYLFAVAILIATQTPAACAVYHIKLNGTVLPQPTRAVAEGGQLMMPVRSLAEVVGFTFDWDQATKTAVATGPKAGGAGQTVEVRMQVDSTAAQVNGEAVELPVAPAIINDTTYVPVAFLVKAFGGQVEWEGTDTGAVNVIVNGKYYPFEFGTLIRNERVMAPVAAFCEKLFKAKVIQHEIEQAVFVASDYGGFRITFGTTKAYLNGRPETLAAPPELIEEVAYAPLGFLVKAFGGTVQWDAATRTLNLLLKIPERTAESAPSE